MGRMLINWDAVANEAAALVVWGGNRWGTLTGQVPPVMMRSKDKASGIPKDIPPEPPEAWESMEASPMDLVFSLPRTEARAEST